MPVYPAPVLHVESVAREWSKLQLAVLGFSGLCGVVQGDSGSHRPHWLQEASGITAVAGILLAVIAVAAVASIAFPLPIIPPDPVNAARRLQVGITITFVAVAITALSAASMWWPSDIRQDTNHPGDRVVITTNSGSTCGEIVDSAAGFITLGVRSSTIRLPLNRVTSIKPIGTC